MSAEKNDIPYKKTIIALLGALFPQAKIYLFGSRARGTHQPGSDIDLAIDDNRIIPTLELGEAKNVINALSTIVSIDLVDLNRIPNVMKKTILDEGIVWKN